MDSAAIRIPSEEECRLLMAEMGMLENIVTHSLQVRRVALFLADHLPNAGLSRGLIAAAALLHDITKTRSFQTGEDHAKTGGELLCERGYPELGAVIRQHVRLDSYSFATPLEEHLVNYADKRVLHENVVTLTERMGYILERYGSAPDRVRSILLLWERTRELEKRLFSFLPFRPAALAALLS